MNSDIQRTLKYVSDNYKNVTVFRDNKEIRLFWENTGAFTWENLCEFASTKINNRVGMYNYTLTLLIHLLETNQYSGKYKNKLKKDLPFLKEFVENGKWNSKFIFSENYDEVVFFTIDDNAGPVVRKIANGNETFRNLFITFVEKTRYVHHQSNLEIDYHFPLSIGDQKIDSYKDVDSETFWNQIRYYQNFYKDNEYMKDRALKTVCRFYRWLVSEYSDYDFFAGSSNLTTELVLNNALIKNINRGAYFTTFTKTEDLGDKPLICFITRNLDSQSTRLKKVDHFNLCTEIIQFH